MKKIQIVPEGKEQKTASTPIASILTISISVISLIISIIALSMASASNNAAPEQINTQEFLQKLASHEESRQFADQNPVAITQINGQNFNELQGKIQGLDNSYLNNYIVEFPTGLAIYDFNNDKVRGTLQYEQQNQLPQDFFTKLQTHPEVQGLENEQPVGGMLDAQTLSTLQQQFPDVYNEAKVGDFLLRYKTRLIVYDYNADRIIKAVTLG